MCAGKSFGKSVGSDENRGIHKDRHQAEAFSKALQHRVQDYGLRINEEKSRVLDFTPHSGKVFHFAGFTFYWGRDRESCKRRLKVKTEKTRFWKKIQEFQAWIKTHRSHLNLDEIWETTAAKLRGHYNYFGVTSNRPKFCHFYFAVVGLFYRWLNRRSQKSGRSWSSFRTRLRNHPLPLPPSINRLTFLIDRRMYAV